MNDLLVGGLFWVDWIYIAVTNGKPASTLRPNFFGVLFQNIGYGLIPWNRQTKKWSFCPRALPICLLSRHVYPTWNAFEVLKSSCEGLVVGGYCVQCHALMPCAVGLALPSSLSSWLPSASHKRHGWASGHVLISRRLDAFRNQGFSGSETALLLSLLCVCLCLCTRVCEGMCLCVCVWGVKNG